MNNNNNNNINSNIYSVGELTESLRKTFAERYPYVWVQGEVSGAMRSQAGHIYFALKDERAQLQCAWFARLQPKGGQKFDPVTGEEYAHPPLAPMDLARNGVELLCAGTLDIYAPRGQYQLLVEFAQPAGMGALALEFERRKRQLAELGYFEVARKRPLPRHPTRVALITSPQGAAIHDFLKISRGRGLASQIRLFPVLVQGQGAAEKMAEAVKFVNEQGWADVIALIRGGGSLEDLWAFNEECLAKAIFESRLPVLAGVGHEVDSTLADMTADVRAATPTEAAQLLWRPRHELWQRLDHLRMSLDRGQQNRLGAWQKHLQSQLRSLRFFSPLRRLERMEEKLTFSEKKFHENIHAYVEAKSRDLFLIEENIKLIMAAKFSKAVDRLEFKASALLKSRELRHKFAQAEARLRHLQAAMTASLNAAVTSARFAYTGLSGRLRALNPAIPLKKGYTLLYNDDNAVIKSVNAAPVGSRVYAMLNDGMLVANVEAQVKKAMSTSGTVHDENSVRN